MVISQDWLCLLHAVDETAIGEQGWQSSPCSYTLHWLCSYLFTPKSYPGIVFILFPVSYNVNNSAPKF